MRRWLRGTPLGWRLTALYIAILTAVLVTLGVVIYAQVKDFIIRDTTSRLTRSAQTSLAREPGPRRGGPPPDAGRVVADLSSGDTVAQIFDVNGNMIASGRLYDEQPLPPPLDSARFQQALKGASSVQETTGSAHQLVLLLPIRFIDGSVGVLQLTAALDTADRLLARLQLILILGALGAVILGALLGVPITAAALRPLAHVTATSERIAAGDLSQRTNLHGGRDEIGRLASAFDRMVDRLDGTLRAQRQFVADASHELRTPLTALSGLVELLLLGVDRGDTATTQRALRSAHREIERLSRLVGDLLTLSRLDARPTVERQSLDLAALVADVGEQTRFLAGERTVTWQSDGPLPVAGDPDRLKQVLLNLTGNAVSFTGDHGQIELRATRHGDLARVEVIDNGVGIPAQELPHLFRRFYRGDRSRVRRADGGGSGLGLAIAHAIVELHGGTMRAASTVGVGTILTVDLPLEAPATPPPDTPSPAAQHAAVSSGPPTR